MTRISYWDGLRGFAALLVVIHHLMIGFYPSTYTLNPASVHTGLKLEFMFHNSPLGLFFNGGFAVALFLLLSGYVVNFSARLVPIKRFFRFFPPLLTVNLLAWLFIVLGWSYNLPAAAVTGSNWWLGQMWQMSPNLLQAVSQSFLSLFTMFPLNQVYNSSAWTMQYFFFGPIVLSLFLLLTKNLPWRNYLLAFLMLFFLKNHYWLIILGYLLGQIDLTKIKLPKSLIQIVLVICFLVFANYPQAYNTALIPPYSWLPVLNFTHTSEFYLGFAAVSLVLLITSSRFLQNLFSSRVFRFMGTISFSLYLSHLLVINTLTSFLFLQFVRITTYSQAFIVSVSLSLVVIFFLAWLIYYLVEKPASRLSQYLKC